MFSKEFIHFNDLIVEKQSTWECKKLLTLDIDWASDRVIDQTLKLIDPSVKFTFFATHNSDILQELYKNYKNIEIGIHPNFDDLILAKNVTRRAQKIIEELLEIIPKVNVLRSHGMSTSGRWLRVFKECKIDYISNYLMYGVSEIRPFRQINGITEVPVYFADDGYLNLQKTLDVANINKKTLFSRQFKGVRVFNFHPIHVSNSLEEIANHGHDFNKRKYDKIGRILEKLQT